MLPTGNSEEHAFFRDLSHRAFLYHASMVRMSIHEPYSIVTQVDTAFDVAVKIVSFGMRAKAERQYIGKSSDGSQAYMAQHEGLSILTRIVSQGIMISPKASTATPRWTPPSKASQQVTDLT